MVKQGHNGVERLGKAESGAALAGLISVVVFVASLFVGFSVALKAHKDQPVKLPTMDLGVPIERSTTTTTQAPRETLDLPTTVETIPDPDTTVAPETPPPTTAPPEINLLGGLDGALLRSANEPRLVDPAKGCDGFTSSALEGTGRSCESITVGDAQFEWVNSATTDQFELMLRDGAGETGDQWRVTLTAPADDGKAPAVIDVTADGKPDLVFSRRVNGDLLLDVIDVSATGAETVLHLLLPNGRARENGGNLVVWVSSNQDGKFAQITLDRSSGSWKQQPMIIVDESAVGSSQF
jgi:hypothetical protein